MTDTSYSLSIEHELELWRHDRRLQHRMPFNQGCRKMLGLGLLSDGGPEDYCHHGLRALAPNHMLRWVALRDIPPGHFPVSPSMNRRVVSYASVTQAKLRHGLPTIDFSQPDHQGWDFRFRPFTPFTRPCGVRGEELVEPGPDTLNPEHYPREMALLNRISSNMTHAAFFGRDSRRRPLRNAWFQRRPEGRPFQLARPEFFMPRAMLAFPLRAMDQLYALSTRSIGQGSIMPCAACHSHFELERFREPFAEMEMFEDGNFIARCPCCARMRKWHLDDAVPARIRRQFPLAFRRCFCHALSRGLKLCATEACTYLGCSNSDEGYGTSGQPDLLMHRFRSVIDGRGWMVPLPRGAVIHIRAGHALEPGELWCRITPDPAPINWQIREWHDQWRRLDEICASPAVLCHLQQVWFMHQCLRLSELPDLVLFPCELVSIACHDLSPVDLWWDLTPALDDLLPDYEAFALPPLSIRGWKNLRSSLPGDVNLDARISDCRFTLSAHGNGRNDRSAPHVLAIRTPAQYRAA